VEGRTVSLVSGCRAARASLLVHVPHEWRAQTQTVPVGLAVPILQARFSPDSKWVAYLSSESGGVEAYVTSFPEANGKWQISADGAIAVRWIPNGQALLYERGDGTIMKVPFAAHGKNAEIGAARPYLSAHPRATTYTDSWDVAADGRIVANTDIGESTHAINVVV